MQQSIGQTWFDRLFSLEEIKAGTTCPPYLYRRTLLSLGWLKLYLHHFINDDASRDRHDHPKRFISIGLRGQYIEDTPYGQRAYRAPWVRTFPATHVHRLLLVDNKPCWTLVLVLRTVREWGVLARGFMDPLEALLQKRDG